MYRIGVPINRRSIIKTNGDLLIATASDYVYMSTVLRTGGLGSASKLSGAIQSEFVNKSLDGWQLIIFNAGDLIISNIPQADSTYDQHVLNAVTGAACKFEGLDSRCWTVYDDELYFGSTGAINKYGGDDDGGSAIESKARHAWIDNGIRQRISAVRPVFTYTGTVDYGFKVDYDYRESLPQYTASLEILGASWDTATWDVSSWGGTATSSKWRASSGTGQSFSINFASRTEANLSWNRTDLRLEGGRNL